MVILFKIPNPISPSLFHWKKRPTNTQNNNQLNNIANKIFNKSYGL